MNIDHLSDWQIEELLIAPSKTRGSISVWGSLDSEAQDQARLHLENCQFCRTKKERLEQSLLLYREAALIKTTDAAASIHTSTHTVAARNTRSPMALRLFWGWPARAFALLLLLAVLISAFIGRERERHQAEEMARTQLLQQQAQQEQTRDDLLLEQVDQEITESIPQAMQSLAQPVLDSGSNVE